MFDVVLRLLFPPHCFLCRAPLEPEEGPHLCRADRQRLIPIEEPACRRCCLPLPPDSTQECPDCAWGERAFDRAWSLFRYEGELPKLVQAFKYEKKRFLIQTFSGLMSSWLEKLGASIFCDGIVPVPLAPEKEKERGFNQAELLARAVAAALDRPVLKQVLAKTKQKGISPVSQMTLSREERLGKIRGTFAPGKKSGQVAGKSLLLVDDVMTTGATAEECARLLKSLGAPRVTVLTLARTPLRLHLVSREAV